MIDKDKIGKVIDASVKYLDFLDLRTMDGEAIRQVANVMPLPDIQTLHKMLEGGHSPYAKKPLLNHLNLPRDPENLQLVFSGGKGVKVLFDNSIHLDIDSFMMSVNGGARIHFSLEEDGTYDGSADITYDYYDDEQTEIDPFDNEDYTEFQVQIENNEPLRTIGDIISFVEFVLSLGSNELPHLEYHGNKNLIQHDNLELRLDFL